MGRVLRLGTQAGEVVDLPRKQIRLSKSIITGFPKKTRDCFSKTEPGADHRCLRPDFTSLASPFGGLSLCQKIGEHVNNYELFGISFGVGLFLVDFWG